MSTHQLTWFTLAALVWLWAALATAFSFAEMPALFYPSPTDSMTPYGSRSSYELYLFIALAIFVIFSHHRRKVWYSVSGIGLLVLVKMIWLGPLLYFRSHTIWAGVRPFDFLPALYLGTELIKVGLLFLTSYWIYRAWNSKSQMQTKDYLPRQRFDPKQIHHSS